MFKKAYNSQFTVFVLSLTLFSVLCSLFSVFAQEEKLSKLMPPRTELIAQKEDKSQGLIIITQYKYSTTSPKEKILDFYRRLFTNEGFMELQGYSPEKKPAGPQKAYFFTKPNNLAMLNILTQPENGLTVYYVTLHKPDVKAINNFKEKEPEKR